MNEVEMRDVESERPRPNVTNAFLSGPWRRSTYAHAIAAGPSVINTKRGLGGSFVVARKDMTDAVVLLGSTCHGCGSP